MPSMASPSPLFSSCSRPLTGANNSSASWEGSLPLAGTRVNVCNCVAAHRPRQSITFSKNSIDREQVGATQGFDVSTGLEIALSNVSGKENGCESESVAAGEWDALRGPFNDQSSGRAYLPWGFQP